MLPAAAASRIALLVASPDGDATPERSSITRCATLFLFGILTLALHARAISGSISSPRTRLDGGVATTKRHDGHEDPRMEFTQKLGAAASAVALSIGGVAGAQDAVQWRVEDGGNGHWYVGIAASGPISWSDARAAAEAIGGHLATISSTAEDDLVAALALTNTLVWPIADRYGPWLGGYQPSPSGDPFGNWAWVTGEPWSYVPPTAQFDNSTRPDGQYDDYLHYIDHLQIWNDVRNDGDTYYGIGVRGYLVEWSADCNNDGIIDFGQIRAGELEDANGNNVPDCCEGGPSCNCPADIARDGLVNGIDLAAVLNNWGSPGGAFNADINDDGFVDGADLAEVLNSWGPCP
jgi:Dockerin type I domain